MIVLEHERPSVLRRIDPRVLLMSALAFSVLFAIGNTPWVLACGVVLGAALVALSPMPLRLALRRIAVVNLFVAAVALTLPLSVPGDALFEWGPLRYTSQGLRQSGVIMLKTNAIVLFLTALIGPVDPVALAHGLSHLRLPDKLVHLLLFTIRYLHVVHLEYLRLVHAMRLRGFEPRANRHTYQTYANLAGMLMVRSFDRSDRVLAAMKCRGFHGRFYMLRHFRYHAVDGMFAAAALAVFSALGWGTWRG